MDSVTNTIRECTGLTLVEFCQTHLETDSRSFSARLRKNRLYPNEAALICLLSGKKPIEVFERSTMETFFVKGKSKKVSAQIKEILDNDPDLDVLMPSLMEKAKPEKKKVKFKARRAASAPTSKSFPKPAAKKIEAEGDPDFKVDVNLFR
jgi:hypothetical protein